MQRALITGITGQDGSFLAEQLLSYGYEVHGMIRRSSSFNTGRIDHIFDKLHLHYGDMTDGTGLRRVLELADPIEVYSLAAQSHVRVSFDQPEYTSDTNALGTLRLLDAIRDFNPRIRTYIASSSEMFGSFPPPQNELTPFRPRSPYGVSKLAAHWYARNYRESYGMFICNGILFNHSSERRGETFVTRKITRAAARIALGTQSRVMLGNLDARRDWGYAPDYTRAMYLMLKQSSPDDYVIATGESHSIREILDLTIPYWANHVTIDPRYNRPAEVDHLLGDASKAREKLGWKPTFSFSDMIAVMLDHDMELAKQEMRAKGQ